MAEGGALGQTSLDADSCHKQIYSAIQPFVKLVVYTPAVTPQTRPIPYHVSRYTLQPGILSSPFEFP